MTNRPTLERWLLDIAAQIARRSTCSRLQVGAVIARHGRILSTGYNGSPIGQPHCACTPEEPCTTAVHAETNAIVFAARHGVSTLGAQLYLTHEPCLACSGIIINSGLDTVVYDRAYRDQQGILRLLRAGLVVISSASLVPSPEA